MPAHGERGIAHVCLRATTAFTPSNAPQGRQFPIVFGILLKATGLWTSCWFLLAILALGRKALYPWETTPIPVNYALGLAAIATAVALGAAGGSYPAIRAARMDPAEALRHL